MRLEQFVFANSKEKSEKLQNVLARHLKHNPRKPVTPMPIQMEGYETIIKYQLEVMAPQTKEFLHEKAVEEKKRQRELKDASNERKMGQLPLIEEILPRIQKQDQTAIKYASPAEGLPRHRSVLDFEPKKVKIKRSKGWGPFGMSRLDFADDVVTSHKNAIMARAEFEDRKNDW